MKRRVAAVLAGCFITFAAAPAAHAETHNTLPDLLEDWLDVQEEAPVAWSEAWLRYEASYSRWLDQTFYADDSPTEKAAQIDQALSADMDSFSERMQQLGALSQGWPEQDAAVQAAFRREFNRVPQVDLYLDYAMADQPLSTRPVAGHASLSLNARFLLPYNALHLRLMVARGLFTALLAETDPHEQADTLANRLRAEGLTAWAIGRLVPEAPLADQLDVSPEDLAKLKSRRVAMARELASALEHGDAKQIERFFGTEAPSGWPAQAGRYLGWLVTQELGHELGNAGLLHLDAANYAHRARALLAKLAS